MLLDNLQSSCHLGCRSSDSVEQSVSCECYLQALRGRYPIASLSFILIYLIKMNVRLFIAAIVATGLFAYLAKTRSHVIYRRGKNALQNYKPAKV